MKPVLFFILGLFLCPTISHAQSKQENEIETLKIAFINDALNLTPKEAQIFWVVYNKYEDLQEQARTNLYCNIYQKLDKIDQTPNKEAETILQDYVKLRNEKHKIWQNFIADLKDVISAKKIMLLKKAEYDFHKKLLEKYRSSGKK